MRPNPLRKLCELMKLSLEGSEVTAQIMARAAYSSPYAPTRAARDIEHDAFVRVTRLLKAALDFKTTGFVAMAQALHENRSLWTTLAADVSDPSNGLPPKLRAQIFSLADFTWQHSERVLMGKATADILIEINTSIMRGLRREEELP